MASFLTKLSEPIWNWASRRYQAAVAKELKKYEGNWMGRQQPRKSKLCGRIKKGNLLRSNIVGKVGNIDEDLNLFFGILFEVVGLRYDDLYDEMYDLDIKEAMSRLPESEILARNARIKRAMDASMKHVYLPKELQAKQTPFQYYLQDALDQVKQERKEHGEVGASMPYNREIP
ncbi:hypothetical protein AXG93_939s1360 [Marchantia polymorpha subsp. ruderalis]|uniref:Cytochrome b-c1 complex subunit 7 n=1 Tax=Marchantia polymorpha subsp. ruderalis TaxID=1480154 RepID=A0A176VP82_MARPO|nr:hypothetical protein AXG93_939s1360 [Marchantia polymorpha subsp. ruderalis]